jgi:hypothetical protein
MGMSHNGLRGCLFALLLLATQGFSLDSLRILWLGNSLTENDATSRAREMDTICKQKGLKCYNKYGAYMYDESWGWYNAPENRDSITKGTKWDYVALQVFGAGGTYMTSSHYHSYSMDSMKVIVRQWDAVIRKAGAKTLLYHPWSVAETKPQWDSVFKAWKPDPMDSVAANVTSMAKELGALVLPVGDAQWNVLQNYPSIPAWVDWIHGTPQIGYLGGLVCYAAITGGDPRTVSTLYGLPDSEAAALRKVAYETVHLSKFIPYENPLLGAASIEPAKPHGKTGPRLNAAPNPFTFGVKLAYVGKAVESTSITISDMKGEIVRSFSVSPASTDNNPVYWDGLNEDGRPAGPGVYVASLAAGTVKTSTLLFKAKE